MQEVTENEAVELSDMNYSDEFRRAWAARQPEEPALLNDEYEATLKRWRRLGVSIRTIEDAIDIAMHKSDVSNGNKYRYMCGIVWNAIEASGVARATDGRHPKIYTQEQVDVMLNKEFSLGMENGIGWCESLHSEGGKP